MDRARRKRNYDLHSWSGVVFGWLIFIVALSGGFALFDEELKAWEDPSARSAGDGPPAAMHAAFSDFADEAAARGAITFLNLTFADDLARQHRASAGVRTDDGRIQVIERRWDPVSGAAQAERGDGLTTWILDFHRDFMWPDALGGRTVGRALVGVVGVVLMLSIVTGVVAHTKITRELFTLRFWRSVRVKWQDSHKILGLWGLPFHAAISATGAFLGVVAILSPIVAVLAFKGDTDALIEAVIGAPPEPAGVAARMLPIDRVAELRHPDTGAAPAFLSVTHWGDAAAVYEVFFDEDRRLARYDAVTLSGVTGEPVNVRAFDPDTPANRVTEAVAPLHYGTYGGLALKALYAALGLSLAVMAALGVMLWVERRLHGDAGRRSPGVYRAMARLTAGIKAGMPLAYAAIFHLDKIYAGGEAARLAWTGSTFFGVWGLAVASAFIRRDDYRTVRALLTAAGAAFAALPIVNAAMTPTGALLHGGGLSTPSAIADLVFLAGGLATILIAARTPSRRTDHRRSARGDEVPLRASAEPSAAE